MLELPTAISKKERFPVPVPRKFKVSEENENPKLSSREGSFDSIPKLRNKEESKLISVEDDLNSIEDSARLLENDLQRNTKFSLGCDDANFVSEEKTLEGLHNHHVKEVERLSSKDLINNDVTTSNEIVDKDVFKKLEVLLEKKNLLQNIEDRKNVTSKIEIPRLKVNKIVRSLSDEDIPIESDDDLKKPRNKFIEELKRAVHKKALMMDETANASVDDVSGTIDTENEKVLKVPQARKRWVIKDLSNQNHENVLEELKQLETSEDVSKKPEESKNATHEKSEIKQEQILRFKENPEGIYKNVQKRTDEEFKLKGNPEEIYKGIQKRTDEESILKGNPEEIYKGIQKRADEESKLKLSADSKVLNVEDLNEPKQLTDGLKIKDINEKSKRYTSEESEPKLGNQNQLQKVSERLEDIYKERKKFIEEDSELKLEKQHQLHNIVERLEFEGKPEDIVDKPNRLKQMPKGFEAKEEIEGIYNNKPKIFIEEESELKLPADGEKLNQLGKRLVIEEKSVDQLTERLEFDDIKSKIKQSIELNKPNHLQNSAVGFEINQDIEDINVKDTNFSDVHHHIIKSVELEEQNNFEGKLKDISKQIVLAHLDKPNHLQNVTEGFEFKEKPEDINEELKKFTDEKLKLKQFIDSEELNDDFKKFSHEKLVLKLSLETEEILEAKNVTVKSSDATRPYELAEGHEMRKFDEEDFPVMTSKLGGDRSSETKRDFDLNKASTEKSNDLDIKEDDFDLNKASTEKINDLDVKEDDFDSNKASTEIVNDLDVKEGNSVIKEKMLEEDVYEKYKKITPEEKLKGLSDEIINDVKEEMLLKEHGPKSLELEDFNEKYKKITPEEKYKSLFEDVNIGSINQQEKSSCKIDVNKDMKKKRFDILRNDEQTNNITEEKNEGKYLGDNREIENATISNEKSLDSRIKSEVLRKEVSNINEAINIPKSKESIESSDGILNTKDESMRRQRDAKYKRMSSFIQDSDEDVDYSEKSFQASNSKFGSSLQSKISLFENHSQSSYMQAINNIDVDLFNPKYRRNPMPLFPKKTNDLEKSSNNAFDTFTRKRGFGIGRAMLDLQDDAVSRSSTPSDIVHSEFDDDEMSDVNVDMFAAQVAPVKVNSANAMDELMGMHSFKPNDILMKKRHSAASLRDAGNIPGFASIRKWSNTEKLDGAGGSNWVVGDSDSEPIIIPKHSEDPMISAGQQFTTSSPPESIASSLATTLSSNIETDINLSKENSEIVENEAEDAVEKVVPPENTFVPIQNADVIDEPEWQYRLPSPPTAFRDTSPTLVENLTVYESTEQFKSDSVVTSPELFEKLKLVKETQSVASEEEKPIFNKLSLENLEKRKSLVYNRELATSLKYKDDDSQKAESISSKRSSVLSELEEVISNSKSSTLNKSAKSDNFVHSDSNLPNFKITTYDMPKKKINIFEDDSIRSNENSCKFSVGNLLKKSSYVGRSMENLAQRKEDSFKKPPSEPSGNRYKAKTLMRANAEVTTVGRSESFSAANWVPINPVKRSKSQVAINQYKEEMNGTSGDGTLSKSNSLFDVSGLQSLEVMRLIQTKLKTPSNSTDELDSKEPVKPIIKEEVNPEINTTTTTTTTIHQTKQQQPEHHRYGPPSINLGTWSERPKSQITLKEDTDYKFNTSNTKLIASTKHNQTDEPTTVNVRVNGTQQQNVSIKVNGVESITPQPSGNVIIKIGGGGNEKKDDGFTSRFINHTTAVGFRKPLGNVNTLDKQRPHSVAFDSNFDISRVPIVRSVELKKHFKDMHINKSITQICPQNDSETKSLNYSVNAKTNPVLRINSFSQNEQSDYTTNKNVPFAQVKLRRTDSNKNAHTVNNNNNNNNIFGNVVLRNTANRFSTGNVVEKPPPPPMMPKTTSSSYIQPPPKPHQPSVDPRDELLSAIRNFGGKKGLKSLKV